MSEMVERVARAIDEASDENSLAFAPQQPSSDEMVNRCRIADREKRFRQAIAAIEAMREPTEEMTTCSDEVHWGKSCYVCGGLTEGWHKMIDAALTAESPRSSR